MCPCESELCTRNGGSEVEETAREESDDGKDGDDARDPLDDNSVDEEDRETAEAGTETTDGLEVLNCLAEAGCNGLRLQGLEFGGLDGGVGVGLRKGFEVDVFLRGFDNQEGGDDPGEGVFDLLRIGQ